MKGTSVDEPFGSTLRERREQRGLSQKALGQASSLSSSMITFLESGERRPTRDQVLRLADALQLSPAETDDLLVSGGHFPRAYERTPSSDRDLVLAADLLGDEGIPDEDKAQFRLALRLAALRWRPGALDLGPIRHQLTGHQPIGQG